MNNNVDLAARILIVYESLLPLSGRADLVTRMDAMLRTVESLKLTEGGGVNLIEAIRAAQDSTGR